MSFYASYPVTGGSGGAVPTYTNLAAFPSAVGAGNGSLAIALDTDILYISNGTVWEPLADPTISPLAITALTGDGTATGPGSAALTLATVNSNVGSFGSASSVMTQTVNAKGLTTAAANVSIQIAESQVTNLVSDLAAKQSTTLTSAHILVGNGSNVATDVPVSGDLTAANTGAFTFNTVNSNVGSFGTATAVPTVTVNAKGLVTAAADTPIQITESQVTNLTTDLAAKQSTTLTSAHILVGNGSNVATDVPMSGDVTIANTGATTIANLAVTNAKIANTTIDLTAKVTGALPIGNGGTGQTTKAPAFDALSPMTTAGDIIYGGTAGTGTRLAPGSGTQVLHGGTTPSWAAVSLTADVTGALPLVNGGTGTAAASANAAFNALSPLAVKGDLLGFSTVNAKLAVGTDGFVLTADAASTLGVKWAAVAVTINSMVRLNTPNGYGSTNDKIRRFTNTVVNTGSDITYADSATLGATFTINTAGVYAISYSDSFVAVSEMGLSLNSNQLTTTIENITISNILAISSSSATNFGEQVCWTGILAVNDVIRAHDAGIASGATASKTQFTISRVS